MQDGTFLQYCFGDWNDPTQDVMTFRALDEYGNPQSITMAGPDVREIAMVFEGGIGPFYQEPHESATPSDAVRVVQVPMVKIRTVGERGTVGWFPMARAVFDQFLRDLRTIGREIAPWNRETTFAGSDPRRAIWRERAGLPLQGPRPVRGEPELRDPTGC